MKKETYFTLVYFDLFEWVELADSPYLSDILEYKEGFTMKYPEMKTKIFKTVTVEV